MRSKLPWLLYLPISSQAPLRDPQPVLQDGIDKYGRYWDNICQETCRNRTTMIVCISP